MRACALGNRPMQGCFTATPRPVAAWAAFVLALLVPRAGPATNIDGFTEPYRNIQVAAAEPGVITALHVREGDIVKPGQLLATLDIEVLEAARKVAEAGKNSQGAIQSAAARLDLKQNRLKRLRELLAGGHANPEEVAVAEADVLIAAADLLASQEDQAIKSHEWERIEAQIQRRHVRSPIVGVVTQIHKDISEYVAATEPQVMTIVQCDRLRAFFPVPAAAAQRLAARQQVQVTFSDGLPPAVGTVEFVSPVIDPESGNVRVKVILDNARGTYRGGLPCSLALPDQARLTEGRTMPLRK